MQTFRLGRDLTPSRIAFGAEQLGGTDWGLVDEQEALRAVAAAWECGVTFFDTADAYGLGRSETRLAKALGSHRHDAVIATKVGVRWEELPGQRARTWKDLSPAYIDRAVEQSLRRLELDVLPMLYLHWPDAATPLEATAEALARLLERGLVRAVGVSNFSPTQVEAMHAMLPLAAVQLPYNLLQRERGAEVLAVSRALGIPCVAYGPLAQGLLTGRFGANARFSSDDRRHRLAHFSPEAIAAVTEALAVVREAAAAAGCTMSQVAIRWLLDQPGISAAIVGARSPGQTAENAAAVDVALEPRLLHLLAKINPLTQ